MYIGKHEPPASTRLIFSVRTIRQGRRSLAREGRTTKPAVGSSLREGQFLCAVTAQRRARPSWYARLPATVRRALAAAQAPPRWTGGFPTDPSAFGTASVVHTELEGGR